MSEQATKNKRSCFITKFSLFSIVFAFISFELLLRENAANPAQEISSSVGAMFSLVFSVSCFNITRDLIQLQDQASIRVAKMHKPFHGGTYPKNCM